MKYILTFLLILSVFFGYSQDTVKVIMQYSDTALCELEADEDNPYGSWGYDEWVYWRYGYAVREMVYKDYRTDDGPQYGRWEIICYLDIDKQRVPETNIVWEYKIIP